MSQALASAREWRISARARGEVLTAGARAAGCQFLVLGVPGGNTIPEIESWLRDLLGVASESSRNDLNPRPIPALLHHALTGLLFSHREVWNAVSSRSPFSLAFVHTEEEVAFGWVGEIEPKVWIDGLPEETPWVRVRDHEGREACAFGVEAGSKVRVSLEWTPGPSAPGAPSVEVEAEWAGSEERARKEEGAEPVAAPPPAEDPASSATPEGEPRRRAVAFDAWRDRVRALEEEERTASSAAVEGPAQPSHAGGGGRATAPGPGDSTAVPPASSRTGDRARRVAGGSKAAPRSEAVPAEARPPGASAAARSWAEAPALTRPSPAPSRAPALPELIPPTPEPPDLTARALGPEAESRTPPVATSRAGAAEEAWPPAAAPRRKRAHAAWPSEREIERARRPGVRPWVWLAAAGALVALAWAAGWLPAGSPPGVKGFSFPALGFGGARFRLEVVSRPEGAWISADGKDLERRTPATIELPAGEHQIALSFPDLGSAVYTVRGARGDRETLDAALWGSLAIRSADSNVPIAVELDGTRAGFAPLTIDSLTPGPHEVRFSGPGLAPWGQALRVRVAEVTEVVARPMTTPANGVLEVRATYTDDNGTNELEGAAVWVDGVFRGVTPLVLELPRGPHSARVEYRGEVAPIQVIDLPGGNQRFASFELGLNLDVPSLVPAPAPVPIPLGRPTVVSAALDGVTTAEVREMWLHVREPNGSWRRYQMTILKAPAGVVGVVVFPTALFDARGHTRYYMSAATQTGDEYFTEILTARSASAPVPIR